MAKKKAVKAKVEPKAVPKSSAKNKSTKKKTQVQVDNDFSPLENKVLNFYKANFKKLMIIPILMFLLSLVFIGITVSKDGTPINRDISLKGGLSAIIEVDNLVSVSEFESALEAKYGDNTFLISELNQDNVQVGYIVDTDLEEEQFKEFISSYFNQEFVYDVNYNSNFISASLSNSFFTQAMVVLGISFVLMSSVVFIAFRQFVPSMAVILSAVFDIVVTIGVLDAFGVHISIAGIGALLMLIGYSIDTDILLTNRLVKEKGENYFEKAFGAFRTGLLMSVTTLLAGSAALFLTNSQVVFEIALILVVGLIVDFVSTWVQNSGILLWWLSKKEGKNYYK